MIRFKRFLEAMLWRKTVAKGSVCVIQGNQRMWLPSIYENDMRLLETEVRGEWV